MESLGKLARPYAVAAFQHAQAAGAADRWSVMLDLLAKVVIDRQVSGIIANPGVERAQVEELIIGIGGEHLDAGAQNFVRVLVQNDRLGLLPDISKQFDEERARAERRSQVMVRSAKPLDDAERSAISRSLEKHIGQAVTMTVDVDESLIGGVLIKAGDLVIDSSIKGRLEQFRQAVA